MRSPVPRAAKEIKRDPSLPLLQKVGPPVPEFHKNWGPCFTSPKNAVVECAPDGGQFAGWELTGAAGLSEDESHGQAFRAMVAKDPDRSITLCDSGGEVVARHDPRPEQSSDTLVKRIG